MRHSNRHGQLADLRIDSGPDQDLGPNPGGIAHRESNQRFLALAQFCSCLFTECRFSAT